MQVDDIISTEYYTWPINFVFNLFSSFKTKMHSLKH
jgi:hypothetical protein